MTHFVDSGTHFVEVVTHLVDSGTHFVDMEQQNGKFQILSWRILCHRPECWFGPWTETTKFVISKYIINNLVDPFWAGALFGSYLQEALASKFARVLPNNVCLLPDDKVKSSLLIVEKISNLLFCHTCDDGSILNLKDQTNVNKEHCTHTFVANTLMENSDKTSFDVADKDNIFVVQENPYYVAVVYPSKERQDSKLRPGVIMKTARMTKTRCRTCKGRDNCFHLNVLKQAGTEKSANENCRSGRLA